MSLRFLCLSILLFITCSFSKPSVFENTSLLNIELADEDKILSMYNIFNASNSSMPQWSCFMIAVKGYEKLRVGGKIKNEKLTIIDFSLSSNEKRLWVLDMKSLKVLFHSVVAHGKNTGGEFASKFSNSNNSFQSSLGFYITDNTYYGKNGLSLFLDGQEKGINCNARKRYVVFHGAKYANPNFAKKNGRLGRSLGCPAVPTALNKAIINNIKEKSCLFIYHPSDSYIKMSSLVS